MTDRNDIVKGLGWYRESTALTDSDIDHIMLYLEEHYSLTTEKKIKSAINVVSVSHHVITNGSLELRVVLKDCKHISNALLHSSFVCCD